MPVNPITNNPTPKKNNTKAQTQPNSTYSDSDISCG